jgi:pyruvate kinase
VSVPPRSRQAVAILVDLQGPKIRLARFESGPHHLNAAISSQLRPMKFLVLKSVLEQHIKVFPGDCEAGDRILIDDGKVTVEVVEVKGNDVSYEVHSARSRKQ